MTFFGIYAPREGHDIDVRQDFFDQLHNLHEEYSRGGSVGYCGDFNTKIRSRTLDEQRFFGPFLFNPPLEDIPDPNPPPPTPNRDLLCSFCSVTDTVVHNTFQDVELKKKVTFFDRRLADWRPSAELDPRWHRELDLLVVSRQLLDKVLSLQSCPEIRIGSTTHHLQLVRLRIPLHKRSKQRGSVRRRIPWDIWQKREV